ncbi:nitrophenyl compound nitroreductase subunit ArsF family protein [uncultured Draconibacterium sp.]|uniref:nitrophenyl compound nitroreductase subunit ArsF family protein n=1 Tax=uncultured Draconibacterium sp. TaxID=1573823 RepID=UPI0032615B75
MKKLLILLALVVVAGVYTASAQCCNSKNALADASITEACCDAKQTDTNVKAYYFHATRRCATCEAVEKVTKQTIAENYKGTVEFVSINREEEENKALVDKYKVSGQTLLLVKGDKAVNLTSPAFMYARNKPEKLEAKLKSTIDSLL